MRNFLINNCQAILYVLTCAELLVSVLLLIDFIKKKQIITLLMFLIGVGLCYDAAVMALGNVIPEDILPALSRFRFVSHGLLVPLNIAICGYALGWKDLKQRIVWGVTLVICALGCASGIGRVLELKEFAGVIRYVAADTTPVWADKINRMLSFGTVIPVIAAGVFVWKKQKTPSFFLAGLLMFVFAALGPATGNADLIFLISMFGELFMLFFFWLYSFKNIKKEI